MTTPCFGQSGRFWDGRPPFACRRRAFSSRVHLPLAARARTPSRPGLERPPGHRLCRIQGSFTGTARPRLDVRAPDPRAGKGKGEDVAFWTDERLSETREDARCRVPWHRSPDGATRGGHGDGRGESVFVDPERRLFYVRREVAERLRKQIPANAAARPPLPYPLGLHASCMRDPTSFRRRRAQALPGSRWGDA